MKNNSEGQIGGNYSYQFRATEMWRDSIRLFLEIPLTRNRVYFKTYEQSFSGTTALTWFHQQLKKTHPFITKQQTQLLLNQLFKAGVFRPVGVAGKAVGAAAAGRPPAVQGTLDLKQVFRLGNAEEVLGCDWLTHTTTTADDVVAERSAAYQVEIVLLTPQETKIIYHNVYRELLKELSGLEISESLLLPASYKSDEVDLLPYWLKSAMDCLAFWPAKPHNLRGLNYPGFETDVFRLVVDYFHQYSINMYKSANNQPSGGGHNQSTGGHNQSASGSYQPSTGHNQSGSGPYYQPSTSHNQSGSGPYCQPSTSLNQSGGPYCQPSTSLNQSGGPYCQPSTSLNQSASGPYQPSTSLNQSGGPYCQPSTSHNQSGGPYCQPSTDHSTNHSLISGELLDLFVKAFLVGEDTDRSTMQQTTTVSRGRHNNTDEVYPYPHSESVENLLFQIETPGGRPPAANAFPRCWINRRRPAIAPGRRLLTFEDDRAVPNGGGAVANDGGDRAVGKSENSACANSPSSPSIPGMLELSYNYRNLYRPASVSNLQEGPPTYQNQALTLSPCDMINDPKYERLSRRFITLNRSHSALELSPVSSVYLPEKGHLYQPEKGHLSVYQPEKGHQSQSQPDEYNSREATTGHHQELTIKLLSLLVLCVPEKGHLRHLLLFINKVANQSKVMLDVAVNNKNMMLQTFQPVILASNYREMSGVSPQRILNFLVDHFDAVFVDPPAVAELHQRANSQIQKRQIRSTVLDRQHLHCDKENFRPQPASGQASQPEGARGRPDSGRSGQPGARGQLARGQPGALDKPASGQSGALDKPGASGRPQPSQPGALCEPGTDEQAGPTGQSGGPDYCAKITLDEYEGQRLLGQTAKSLRLLLQTICEAEDNKTKTKRLKMFEKEYPHIYMEKFGSNPVLAKKTSSKNILKNIFQQQ